MYRTLQNTPALAGGARENRFSVLDVLPNGLPRCLRYPPRSYADMPAPTSSQVKQEMEALLRNFDAEAQGQVVPLALYSGLRKRWNLFGEDLLHCFDIPGLPQDNLKPDPFPG